MSQNWRKKKTGYQVRTNLVSFRSWAVVVVVVVVVSFLSTGFLLYMIGHHMIHCKTPKWEPNEPIRRLYTVVYGNHSNINIKRHDQVPYAVVSLLRCKTCLNFWRKEVTTKFANGGGWGSCQLMFQMREEEGDSVLANQVCKERCSSCASGGWWGGCLATHDLPSMDHHPFFYIYMCKMGVWKCWWKHVWKVTT